VGDVWGPFSLSNAMKRSSPAFSKKKNKGNLGGNNFQFTGKLVTLPCTRNFNCKECMGHIVQTSKSYVHTSRETKSEAAGFPKHNRSIERKRYTWKGLTTD